MSNNPYLREKAPKSDLYDNFGGPDVRPPPPHPHVPNSHSSNPLNQGYWVAPDGTKHAMTERQVQQMSSQAPVQTQNSSSAGFTDSRMSSLPAQVSDSDDRSHHNAQLDPLDQELLAEAQQDPQHHESTPESDKQADDALEQSLAWIPKSEGQLPLKSGARLAVPIAIPQTAPGIQSSFSRAWAPILADHDVRPADFLQFLDHLNVCKAASPPLQLLNLAGTIVGFAPVPFAFAISMGTSAVATGGQMAVARVRITRYLERVNKEYFHPRGLQARIAKQNSLPQIIGQSPGAPLLAPLPPEANTTSFPSLRDRRLQALGDHIAHVEFEDSSTPSEEHNLLDKISAKMTARKAERSEQKMVKKHMKHKEERAKEEQDLVKERAKLESKMQKASRKGDREKLYELEGEMREAEGSYQENITEGSGKELKAAKKFMFVVIQDLEAAAAVAPQHQ